VVPVVISSVVVGVGIVALVLVGLYLLISSRFGPQAPDQPLATGAPGSPLAEEPLDCVTACFTEESIPGTLAFEAELYPLGLTEDTFPSGTYDPAPVQALVRASSADWATYDGEPDVCSFAVQNSPFGATLTSDAGNEDMIYFTGTHQDEDLLDSFDQSVRIFPDTVSATGYMTALASSIDDCDVVTIGPPSDRYSATITPAPALHVDPGTAAVGWVRTGVPGLRWRAYVFDVQYGNLVARTRLLTDGEIREKQFRDLVSRFTDQLSSLEPVKGE
jgi:hypothetical protein